MPLVSPIAGDVRAIAGSYAAHLHHLSSLRHRLPLLRALHAHIITSGFVPRAHILNRLIDLYSKSGDILSARRLFDSSPLPDAIARTSLLTAYSNSGLLPLARQVFDETPLWTRDTVFYNAMISAYSRASYGPPAVSVFLEMLRDGFRPDDYTYTGILSASASIPDLTIHQCQLLHCAIVKSGAEHRVSVSNALIALYFKCGTNEGLVSAHEVFDRMIDKDELTWTTMVVGYVRFGDIQGARLVFDEMDGRFDVVWNAMISGYAQHGLFFEALELFRRMHLCNIPLDEFSYTSTISACVNAGFFKLGKAVHGHIIRVGPNFEPESALPVENVLVTLYANCGKVDVARQIFNRIQKKDHVSWNAILTGYLNSGRIQDAVGIFNPMPSKNCLAWMVMISGFVHNGLAEEGLKLFNQMRNEGFIPCDYTYAGTFAACGELGALEHGRQLHAQLIRFGYESSNSAGNALLTMYAKCGAMDEAELVFFEMPYLDPVSWNAMISALAHHGHGDEAIKLYDQMVMKGIYPDRITFLTVLSACSHAGLVDEGFMYFETMERDYGIKPEEDHYARLIDLLGRAGRITEARKVIESMPFKPGPLVWEAVLTSCRLKGDMDLGVQAAEQLFNTIPQQDGTYVLLSNIYAAVGRWEDVARVRKMMRERGVKKEPGCSWIEVSNKVHVFLVNDVSHPEVHEVYNFLDALGAKMRKLGYVPDTRFVLHDMEAEQKEYVLSTHSEKLAVGYGLLRLPVGATIRVLKNIRICGDCHTAILFMSKAVGREIIVRDVKRFHHFKDGECSCGNYW
ncbi:pentatricopeptide repeat-containing protein At1g25360 [Dioscorea cayenensis subsp. rotundata]|uniref:Pentatricopeptide repeat-containing protein At1g25360 n=1 Tax=Dioscorea cayennensis subsp. rotundata TaxID=55577 RepID=A0AB40AS68_DIOCR|nr:pentatricopeptide repeat-containing protein At1g25360 [Dioscorea cayenensis subsp. rotundata]XP_039117718.1 pentatricopeptide repeat-containing protein At1g25360 [Dioscorea cayenensis subsp. rotundata]